MAPEKGLSLVLFCSRSTGCTGRPRAASRWPRRRGQEQEHLTNLDIADTLASVTFMSPDTYALLLFLAGTLAGIGGTVLALVLPDAVRAIRRLNSLRRQRRET